MEPVFAQTTFMPGGPLGFVNTLLGLVSLVCYIIVVAKMFQNGESTTGTICIVFLVCGGIGYWIAFVHGWIRRSRWNLQNVMILWTIAVVACIALGVYTYTTTPIIDG